MGMAVGFPMPATDMVVKKAVGEDPWEMEVGERVQQVVCTELGKRLESGFRGEQREWRSEDHPPASFRKEIKSWGEQKTRLLECI